MSKSNPQEIISCNDILFCNCPDLLQSPGTPKPEKCIFIELFIRDQEKGVLAKGVSVESSDTAKETKNIQGYWPQQ